jgi:hypothetical protein
MKVFYISRATAKKGESRGESGFALLRGNFAEMKEQLKAADRRKNRGSNPLSL